MCSSRRICTDARRLLNQFWWRCAAVHPLCSIQFNVTCTSFVRSRWWMDIDKWVKIEEFGGVKRDWDMDPHSITPPSGHCQILWKLAFEFRHKCLIKLQAHVVVMRIAMGHPCFSSHLRTWPFSPWKIFSMMDPYLHGFPPHGTIMACCPSGARFASRPRKQPPYQYPKNSFYSNPNLRVRRSPQLHEPRWAAYEDNCWRATTS